MSRQKSGVVAGLLLPLGLVCLFAFCSLALALFGGRAYRQIQDGVDDGFGSTVAAGYLTTKLSQNNRAGAVSLRREGDVELLVIERRAGDALYETRIYWRDGCLRESDMPAEAPFSPSPADSAIAEVSRCDFAIDGTGLFTARIVSEGGTVTQAAFALAREGTP